MYGRYQNSNPFEGGFDSFGTGGITYQLDYLLIALKNASERDDAREYASLSAQLAVILRPKLSPEEYVRLSVPAVIQPNPQVGKSKRELRREYEKLLFQAARANVAEMLYLVSQRGIYAKEDKSPEKPLDAGHLALRD